MSGTDKISLYWNTVKFLKPVQIKHQIKNRVYRSRKKKLLDGIKKLHVPDIQKFNIVIPELDFDKEYLHRFNREGLLKDEITLLHETHKLEDCWNIPEALHLWNYNLHYLEFLLPLAVKYEQTLDEQYFCKFENLLNKWMKQSSEDSFEPYTISMRIPNLLICMELLKNRIAETSIGAQLQTSIYQQYQYLLRTQELGLLANHYFENLKTIVISSLLFREQETYHKYFNLLLKQIEEQILEDGMHFERSFMYHKIILEDILRIHEVLISTEHKGDAEKLIPTIQKMTLVIENIEKGFHRTPLFNDAGNNVSKSKEALVKAAGRICGYGIFGRGGQEYVKREGLRKSAQQKKLAETAFSESGYYKLYTEKAALLFDCGKIGPSYMGGHAHCDCLSFELALNGDVIFVNSGTGQYQGELRRFFRSTSAHNTIMIDDREQSELWGEHRAGRRISKVRGNTAEEIDGDTVTGSFRSYYGDNFRRRMRLTNENRLFITDDFTVHRKGRHIARQFFHIAPGYSYERKGKTVAVKKGTEGIALISLPDVCDYLIHTEGMITNYAEDFGKYECKQVLEIRTIFEDKLRSKIEIRLEH